MKFRNLIFILAIAFTAIFAIMIGTSYAYYFATGGVPISGTTPDINTGVAVVFKQSQYINVANSVPIKEEDVDTLASTSMFTLTPNASMLEKSDVAVNISLIDIAIDNAFRETTDFKYKFSCTDGTTTNELSSGTGSNFTADVISAGLNLGTLSTTNGTFDVNKNYTCSFRVWIQETPQDQGHLMGKSFSGLIKVNTVFKIREM